MATWKGLEPSTSAVTGRRSNQLNYQAAVIVNKTIRRYLVGGTGIEPVTLAL